MGITNLLPTNVGDSLSQIQSTWNLLKKALQWVPQSQGGIATVETDGVNKATKITTVTHSLGRVPTDIQLTPQRSEAGIEQMEAVVLNESITDKQFKIRGLGGVVFAAATVVPIHWRASVD